MLTRFCIAGVAVLLLFCCTLPANAQLPGAIFTTLSDGSRVNANIYPSKEAVYLDGGPPPGAPQGAAGLPDGIYVFQVTDPSGKVLLSTDIALCRQFTVLAGIITDVVHVGGCEHVTGLDIDHGAATVQLMPYADTPNNGGVYKAWVTPVDRYLQGCEALGESDGLHVVDCGSSGGDRHGFINRYSKTDNFKVKGNNVSREIDTKFTDANGNLLLGLCLTWIDTLGVSNTVCSGDGVQDWAHIEQPENGIHEIIIYSQPGCVNFTGGVSIYQGNNLIVSQLFSGGPGSPVTLDIQVKPNFSGTIVINVYCNP